MTTKPREVNLNIGQMRQDALLEMLDALRAAVKRFDDIDGVERVLYGEAAVEIKKRVGAHTNWNGNGARSHHAREQVPDEVSLGPALDRPLRSKKKHAVRSTSRKSLQPVALKMIGESPGISTPMLVTRLKNETTLIDPRMSDRQAATTVTHALKPYVADNSIRTERKLGMGGTTKYFPAAHAAPAKSDHAAGKSRYTRLREFLMGELIAAKGAVVKNADLHKKALENGFESKWGKADTLRNQLARALREFAADHKAKSHGKGKGDYGMGYSIVRPRLEITKSSTVESARA